MLFDRNNYCHQKYLKQEFSFIVKLIRTSQDPVLLIGRPVPDLDCKDVELAELENKENLFCRTDSFPRQLRGTVILLNLL